MDRPHTLPAQHLYLSRLAPSLQQYSRDLKERQQVVQTENIELLDRVMQQRREIEGLVRGFENVVADLDASVASLQSSDMGVDGLRDQNRDVENDMRMSTES